MDIPRVSSLRPQRRLAYVVAAVAGVVALPLVLSLSRSSASAAPGVERNAVWTEHVHRGDLVRQVPVQGTLVPEHVQWLSAGSAARVAHIVLRPGAVVEPDSVVVVLENPELELAALEAERQAASAQAALITLDVKTRTDEKTQESSLADLHAQLRDADRHASAAGRLAPEGLMSDLDFRGSQDKATGLSERVQTEEARAKILHDGRTEQLAAQRAEVERLREIAAFRRRQRAALEVRAGIAGVVQDVPLENGQWVAIGTLLAKVAEPGRLKADVRVAEGNARDVHRGLSVRFESPNGNWRGRVERVDPAVVAGSVRLEVELGDDVPAGARADQNVSGYVEIETLPNVLYVARPAGVQEGAVQGVFRLEPDHAHAARVTARFGRGSASELEILGGLAEGDEVVVSDTTAWEPATRVRLK